jgi:hypothetical protein
MIKITRNILILLFIVESFISCNYFTKETQVEKNYFQSVDSFITVLKKGKLDNKVFLHSNEKIDDFPDDSITIKRPLKKLWKFEDTTPTFKFKNDHFFDDVYDNFEYTPHIISRPTMIKQKLLDNSPKYGSPEFYFFAEPFRINLCKIEQADPEISFNGSWISHYLFDSSVYIINNYFNATLIFSNIIFRAKVVVANPFIKPILSAPLIRYLNCNFENCKFESGLYFTPDGSNFNIQKRGSSFKNDLNFYKCIIKNKLDLSHCYFDSLSNLVFEETNLPDTLDLSYSSFSDILDLQNVPIKSDKIKCQINLIGFDFDKIQFQYRNFHLYFPDSIFNLEENRDIVSNTYEKLLASFKKKGLDDSYEKLDIEFKDWQSKHDTWILISRGWWQYGYAKGRILILTLVFLILFSLLNLAFYDKLLEVYKLEKLQKANFVFSTKKWLKICQKFILSVLFTGFIFFKVGLDFDKLEFKYKGLFFLIIFEFGIGLLCSGYILNWILSK